jgi:hypothetical protein
MFRFCHFEFLFSKYSPIDVNNAARDRRLIPQLDCDFLAGQCQQLEVAREGVAQERKIVTSGTRHPISGHICNFLFPTNSSHAGARRGEDAKRKKKMCRVCRIPATQNANDSDRYSDKEGKGKKTRERH